MNLIIDASVAAKWMFIENFNSQAESLINGDHILQAPDFLLLEIANIVWKKTVRGEIKKVNIQEPLFRLRTLVDDFFPFHLYVNQALRIGDEINHSIYDCLYLSMAVDLNYIVTGQRQGFIG